MCTGNEVVSECYLPIKHKVLLVSERGPRLAALPLTIASQGLIPGAYQPAAHVFPERQGPDLVSTYSAPREGGRAMNDWSDDIRVQTHMKLFRREWPLRPRSGSERVINVSFPWRPLNTRCPSGQTPPTKVKTLHRCHGRPGPADTRAVQYPGSLLFQKETLGSGADTERYPGMQGEWPPDQSPHTSLTCHSFRDVLTYPGPSLIVQ